MSEHADQFEEREHEGQDDGSDAGEQQGGLPSEEDRKQGTEKGNRESGTHKSGAQRGDVAHEGDLPTVDVPEAD